MAISGCITSVFQTVGVWFEDIKLMAGFLFFSSVAHSNLIIGGNAEVLREWDIKSVGWIQGLHGSFALGALVTPLIIQPFVTTTKNAENVKIQRAFLIDGSILIISSIVSFITWLYYFRVIKYSSGRQKSMKELFSSVIKAIGFNRKFCFLCVVILYFILEVGMEATSISIMSHFAVHYLKWNEKKAALLVFSHTLCYSIARFFNAGITRCLKITLLIIISFFITITAMLMLSLSYKHEVVVWTSISLMGVGRAALYPGCVVFVDQYLPVRQSLGIVFHLSASVGSLIIPQIGAHIVEHQGYQWYGVVLLVTTSAMFIAFSTLIWISKTMSPQKQLNEDNMNEKITMSDTKEISDGNKECNIHTSITDQKVLSYSDLNKS